MTTPADVHDVRDPELPGRLLATERDDLVPLLRSREDADFALPVAACPGWTVRDVLAHCSSALTRAVENRFEEGVFSPEANDRDIAERADWSNARVVDELERGMTEAGPVIGRAGGALDGLALGEWVHAGDVRAALGEPGAYAGGPCRRRWRCWRRSPASAAMCRSTPTWTTSTNRSSWAGRAVTGRRGGSSATPRRWSGSTPGGRSTGRRSNWPGWRRGNSTSSGEAGRGPGPRGRTGVVLIGLDL